MHRLVSFASMPYLVVFIGFLVLWFGFDFNGLYGQDAHEYFRYSKALKLEMVEGIAAGDFHWPKLYSLLGAILSFTGIPVLFSLELITLFSCLGAMYFAQKSIRLLYNVEGTLFLLLGAATQVYFVRMGFVVMSDALCAFFIMATIYFYLSFNKNRDFKHLGWILLFSSLAIFTRYASLPILVVLMTHSLWMFLKQWKFEVRVIGLFLLGIAGVCILYFNNQALSQIMDRIQEWSPINLFHRTHFREGRQEINFAPNLVYIGSNFLHLGFLSFGMLLLPWVKHWNFRQRVLWIAIMTYLFFIGGLEIQNQRFMVLTHLPILILIFPSFQQLKSWLELRKLMIPFVAGVLIFNLSLFLYSFGKTYQVHRIEKLIVEELHTFEDDTPILSFYVNQSFASYDLPNPTQDLWNAYPDFYKGGLVVFNPEKFEEFWSDGIVMQNWLSLKEQHELTVIKELPDNWKIYRIE